MISKPPLTGNAVFDLWLGKLFFLLNNTIKTLDVPVSKSGVASNYVHGKHPTRQVTSGNSVYFGFTVPTAVEEIKEVTIRFIPTTTGTVNYTVNLSYGGIGDDENANTATLSATLVATTDDQLQEIDVTSLFSAVDADDQVGVELAIDAFATTTDLQVLSLYFKYV